jgi:hypothetical protein
MIWIALGAGAACVMLVVLVAFCTAAARGDAQLEAARPLHEAGQ